MKNYKIIICVLLIFAFSCNKTKKENNTIVSGIPIVQDSVGATETSKNADLVQNKSNNNIELKNFYKQNEKKSQLFELKANEDQTIVCAEKTKIKIYANSFVSVKTGKAIVGKIQILVAEYYKISDILLANLSTMSNNKMLETGGMINIRAQSNGDECKLKYGKQIEIEFSKKTEKKGMQLFAGNWNNNQINWTIDEKSIDLNKIYNNSDVDSLPKFPGGIQKFHNFISTSVFRDVEIQEKIKVYVSFTVDKDGNVVNPKIINGKNKEIDAAVLNVFSKSPKFIPATKNGIAVNTIYTLPIVFESDNYEIVLSEESNYKTKEEIVKSNKEVYEKEKTIKNFYNYAFSASSLGWINCDRFLDKNFQLIDYVVNGKNIKNSIVNIVFKNINSIISQTSINEKVNFNNFPKGEIITIFAIKFIDKQPYFAQKDTKVTAESVLDLEFKPISDAMLLEEIKKLDK